MVTGPMPRKPKATRPKAKIAGAIIEARPGSSSLIQAATPIRPTIAMPIQ